LLSGPGSGSRKAKKSPTRITLSFEELDVWSLEFFPGKPREEKPKLIF
jgi:hypothetical protein